MLKVGSPKKQVHSTQKISTLRESQKVSKFILNWETKTFKTLQNYFICHFILLMTQQERSCEISAQSGLHCEQVQKLFPSHQCKVHKFLKNCSAFVYCDLDFVQLTPHWCITGDREPKWNLFLSNLQKGVDLWLLPTIFIFHFRWFSSFPLNGGFISV